jgi:ABC-type sugar transport system permease subunit
MLNAIQARNLLFGVGAYYLSWWVGGPLAIGFGKVTHGMGIHYYGDFAGGVVMPIVLALPYALVAAVVGASVAWIVESDRPIGWTLVPTFLYALGVFHPSRWVRPPTPLERVGDAIRMLLPAVACIVAGIVAAKRRAASRVSRPTPG